MAGMQGFAFEMHTMQREQRREARVLKTAVNATADANA
jgi:hypothetical protein